LSCRPAAGGDHGGRVASRPIPPTVVGKDSGLFWLKTERTAELEELRPTAHAGPDEVEAAPTENAAAPKWFTKSRGRSASAN